MKLLDIGEASAFAHLFSTDAFSGVHMGRCGSHLRGLQQTEL